MAVTYDTKQASTYRERAEQVRAMAKRLTDEKSAATARHIADSYEALAEIAERVGRRPI